VRYLLPAGALLAIAACIPVRMRSFGGENSSVPESRGAVAVSTPNAWKREGAVASAGAGSPKRPDDPAPREVAAIFSVANSPKAVSSRVPPQVDEMLTLLEPLQLSEEQMSGARAILEDRALELHGWQESVRKSGVFNPEEYGRQLQRRRDTWYRALDALLDSVQHFVLQDLMARGFLGQGTEFVVDRREMIVIR
jgi:hypothetical protein